MRTRELAGALHARAHHLRNNGSFKKRTVIVFGSPTAYLDIAKSVEGELGGPVPEYLAIAYDLVRRLCVPWRAHIEFAILHGFSVSEADDIARKLVQLSNSEPA